MLRVLTGVFIIAHHLRQFQLICLNILLMLKVFIIVFTVAHHLQQFHLIYLGITLMLQLLHVVFTVAEILHYQHLYLIFKHYKQNSRVCLAALLYCPQQTATQVQSNLFGITSQLHLTTIVSKSAQP